MKNIQKDTQKFKKYLFKKSKSVYEIYSSFETSLNNNKIDLHKRSLSIKDFDRAYRHLEDIEGNLFRQAMLVMVLSYLDEAMKLIGEASISNYSAKISEQRKGSWFEKQKKLFEKYGVSFEGIKDECERINDLIKVRNCIVHAGGRIDKCRNPKQVEIAISRLKERDKDRNFKLVDITSDKFLCLGEDIIATAIIASNKIIEQCSKTKLGCEGVYE